MARAEQFLVMSEDATIQKKNPSSALLFAAMVSGSSRQVSRGSSAKGTGCQGKFVVRLRGCYWLLSIEGRVQPPKAYAAALRLRAMVSSAHSEPCGRMQDDWFLSAAWLQRAPVARAKQPSLIGAPQSADLQLTHA